MMARIYVDIPVLEHSSGDVKGMGDSVESAGKSAKSAEGMAGDYEMDGASNYRSWIRGICSNAYSQAKTIDGKLDDLGNIIKKKAVDFLRADNESVIGIEGKNSLLIEWIERSSILGKFAGIVGDYLKKIEAWLKLSSLLGGTYLSLAVVLFVRLGLARWGGNVHSGKLSSQFGILAQKSAFDLSDSEEKSASAKLRDTLTKPQKELIDKSENQSESRVYKTSDKEYCAPFTVNDYSNDKLTITQNYKGKNHYGIDIAPIGESRKSDLEVLAIADGKVVKAGWDDTGYGNFVKIQHDDGYYSLYAHLEERPIVNEGNRVKAGSPIGIMGSTGKSTGTHLHLEIRTKKDQQSAVDPRNWLPDIQT